MTKKDIKKLLILLEDNNSEESIKIKKKLQKELQPIKISSRKAKGRNLQQLVADLISKYTNIPTGKDELISSREMGQSGTDIRLIGKAKELFPFAIECKSQENLSVYTWIKQAKSNIGNFKYWLLVHKRNNVKPIVILDLEDFFDIYFNKSIDKNI